MQWLLKNLTPFQERTPAEYATYKICLQNLTPFRARLKVNHVACAELAVTLGIDRLLVVGPSFKENKPTIHMVAGNWSPEQ